MNIENVKPADIERRSMEMIEAELPDTSWLSESEKLVVKRVIHTTADFDYLHNLKFSACVCEKAFAAFRKEAVIVTDTQMALSGISKPAAKALGLQLCCFMSDEDVVSCASKRGRTRAFVSMEKAVRTFPDRPLIFVIGNAPTALLRIADFIMDGTLHPALVIGAPVGFVNVIQSKEAIMKCDVPYIVASGRKGGSTVAAAICNALLYQIYDRNGN